MRKALERGHLLPVVADLFQKILAIFFLCPFMAIEFRFFFDQTGFFSGLQPGWPLSVGSKPAGEVPNRLFLHGGFSIFCGGTGLAVFQREL